MVAAIEIQVTGQQRIEQRLAGLVKLGGNLQPLMEGLALYGESSTIDRFDTETDPLGRPWKPSLRAKQEGGKTLTDSARMRQSVTSNATAQAAEWGSNLIYYGVHNEGARITGKNGPLKFRLPGGLGFRSVPFVDIAQRQSLGISDEDETEMLALVDDFVALTLPEGER